MVGYGRITVEANKMGGAPCIRGYRMPVSSLLRMLADGWTFEEMRSDHPWLEREDVAEALRFAADLAMGSETLVPLSQAA